MNKPRRILVKCTYVIPVEFPEDWTDDMIRAEFVVKCPGTGFVGAAFADHLKKQEEQSICWACTLNAEMEIIDLNLESPDPPTAARPRESLSEEVRKLADDPASRIDAIKLQREQSGASLIVAKDAVEAYVNSKSTQS